MPDLTSMSEPSERLRTALLEGRFGDVTVEEWLQISFLELLDSQPIDIEYSVVYGGNRFLVHACVTSVGTPAAPARRKK